MRKECQSKAKASPKFCRPRQVRQEVSQELYQLEGEGVTDSQTGRHP